MLSRPSAVRGVGRIDQSETLLPKSRREPEQFGSHQPNSCPGLRPRSAGGTLPGGGLRCGAGCVVGMRGRALDFEPLFGESATLARRPARMRYRSATRAQRRCGRLTEQRLVVQCTTLRGVCEQRLVVCPWVIVCGAFNATRPTRGLVLQLLHSNIGLCRPRGFHASDRLRAHSWGHSALRRAAVHVAHLRTHCEGRRPASRTRRSSTRAPHDGAPPRTSVPTNAASVRGE